MDLGLRRRAAPGQARTMDVLRKFERVPLTLRAFSLERISRSLSHTLHSSQHVQPKSLCVLGSTEGALRDWLDPLPPSVREDLMASLVRRLIGGSVTGSLGMATNLPVLLASAVEIVYNSQLQGLTIPSQLQWHRESRLKVLHLLHQKDSVLSRLALPCYAAPIFKFENLQFSEKYILINSFYRFRHLRSLSLPNVCDDEILAYVGSNCKALEDLNVTGSIGVTNQGMKWFTGAEEAPLHPVTFEAEPSLKSRIARTSNPKTRPGFAPTPMALCKSTQAKRSTAKAREKMTKINLEGTSVDILGLEITLKNMKGLKSISLDDCLWERLLQGLQEDSGDLCLDCLGPNPNVSVINMTCDTSARHLIGLVNLFPSLEHITLNRVTEDQTEDLKSNLECLERLRSLTIKDSHFHSLSDCLQGDLGGRIDTLCFAGKTSSVDCSQLSSSCPNLKTLSLTHCTLLRLTDDKKLFPRLKSLKLWEVRLSDPHVWLQLLSRTCSLERLYLWNLVITDSDLLPVLSQGALSNLEDLRIGSSEIGYLRLSEDTVMKLLSCCPRLSSIGGLCDWNTRDLLSLLHHLLLTGGWRINLE